MRLTEKKVVQLIREAYEDRLYYFLNEKMDLEVMGHKDADQLKVRHSKTRYEYTFGGINDEGLVICYLPDEPRFNVKDVNQQRLLSDYIPESDESYDYAGTAPPESVVRDDDDRDYILVDKATFEKEYELAWWIKKI